MGSINSVYPISFSLFHSSALLRVSLLFPVFLFTPSLPLSLPLSLWMAAYLCACVWELAGAEINHSNGFALLLILS